MDLTPIAQFVGTAIGASLVTFLSMRKALSRSDQRLSSSAPSREPRILIVEDEVTYANLLARVLTDPRHGNLKVIVDIAHNAEEAIALVEAYPYRLHIIDNGLPGMSGLDLAVRLRTKVFIHTGAELSEVSQMRSTGIAQMVIVKSMDSKELIAAVRAAL